MSYLSGVQSNISFCGQNIGRQSKNKIKFIFFSAGHPRALANVHCNAPGGGYSKQLIHLNVESCYRKITDEISPPHAGNSIKKSLYDGRAC